MAPDKTRWLWDCPGIAAERACPPHQKSHTTFRGLLHAENRHSIDSLRLAQTTPRQKTSLLISIPKKTVRLATQRNRLKRLIRECFRKELFIDRERVYQFRVIKNPGDPGFSGTRDCIQSLIVKS